MREVIATSQAPGAVGPYSQAIKSNGFVFTAGQIALDPESGTLVGEEIAVQTRQVMQNVAAILEAAGSGLEKVVKTTIFVTDLAHFKTVNAVYGEFFEGPPPARSTVEVSALPLGALVEIETIAVL
jgi:2-iminobutanoate/2-iminopropanoate deaminase